MGWTKKSDYHAENGDWTLTRYVVGGVDKFVLWHGQGYAHSKNGARAVPKTFNTSVEAVEYLKWMETGARDSVEKLLVTKPLTAAQMEMI